MEYQDRVCHFCLVSQDAIDLIALNDEELTAKIHRIFYFEVTFPSKAIGLICVQCKKVIEEFYCYAERVARNQEQLRAQLCTKQLKQEVFEIIIKSPDMDDVPLAIDKCPNDPSNEIRLEQSIESTDRKGVEIERVDEVMNQSWVFKEEEEVDEMEEQEIVQPDSESEQSSPEPESMDDDLPNKGNKPEELDRVKETTSTADTSKDRDTTLTTERLVLQHYKLSCDLCSAPLADFSDLGKHYKHQHNVTGYLRCCSKKIIKKCWMIEHLQLHLNPDAFRCEQCAKSYSSSKVLKEHIKEVHAPATERSFPCTTCKKAFVSRAHLNAHVMVAHGSVSCPECDKVLASQGSLRKHLVAVHGEGEKHVCEVCARVFRSKQSFETHRKVHEGSRMESKVQCDMCQAWLMDKYCLTKHMRRMHADQDGDPVECGTCGKTLRNQNALSCHMWRAHSESRFECERCHKRFKRPHHMREHIAIHHTGEELYGCQYCSERFNTKNKQYSHRKTAHPEEFAEELRKRMLKE
uniref:C2H2-type domain-containing protein n=1 Tax=Anopheles christyi TaxID=43041 RepID=A0A182JNL7_9DIPT